MCLKPRLVLLMLLVFWLAPPVQVASAKEPVDGQPSAIKNVHPIPYRSDTEKSVAGLGVRVAVIFAVILFLAFGSIYAIKRWLPNIYTHRAGTNDLIRVQETRRITPRLTLLVLDFEGTRLLVAQSGDRTVTLAQSPIAGRGASTAQADEPTKS